MSRYSAGNTLGRFELVSPLGRGGMGEVWRARHVRTEAVYALKIVFRDTGPDEDVFRRFDREVKAAARIGHPGIVEVVDCDVDERTGCPYLVMEILDGADLGAWRRETNPRPSQIVALIRNALEPLAAAHGLRSAEGAPTPIVHRDLKPDNVFVLRHPIAVPGSGATQSVKLLDFGIARQQGMGGTTGTLGGIGTPGYMSPEQAREAKEVGPSSDVFSIGVMLYEALAGTRPFEGSSVAEIMAQLLTAEPQHLLQRAPQLDPRIAALVHRCLAKDPATRPADAGVLRDELDRLLADAHVAGSLDGLGTTRPMDTLPLVMGAADVLPSPPLSPPVAPTTAFDPPPAPSAAIAPRRKSSSGTKMAIAAVSAFSVLALGVGIWLFTSGEEVPLPSTPNIVPSLRDADWSLHIGPYRDERRVLDVASWQSVAFGSDGTLSLVAQYNSGIAVWRLREGRIEDTSYAFPSSDGAMGPVAAGIDGTVVLGMRGGSLVALARDGSVTRVELGEDEIPLEMAASPDGRRVAVLCTTGRIFSADLPMSASGLTRHALLGSRRMRTIGFDHAGHIIAGGDAAQVQRETENGGWEALPLPVQGRVTAVGWDRTGGLLASDEVGNIMRYSGSRWSRMGGVRQPAIAVQDTPHHGVVAARADGRIFVQADGDFSELPGFDDSSTTQYGRAAIWGDNVLLYGRFGILVHAADERWTTADLEAVVGPADGCEIVGEIDGLEAPSTPRVLLDCAGRVVRAGADGLAPLTELTLGATTIPARRLVSLMREQRTPYDVAAGTVWRTGRREEDVVVERWDPARDAWDVVMVNEPVEGRVYRFDALDVVETPEGARVWAFDRANDVRVATVPAGPIERPLAFTTVLTDRSLREVVGLRFGARSVRLVATAERAYLVYEERTIVEVGLDATARLLRFGGEERQDVLDADDSWWDAIAYTEPATRLVLAGDHTLVSQAGRLYELVEGGQRVEWTVDGVDAPAWSIGDSVLAESGTTYLLLDGWLVRCAERRCVDAGTRGAIAFTRVDRAAPGTLALFREDTPSAYGLLSESQ